MKRAERLIREHTGLSLVRAVNEQRVLETLLREGPTSRARIARLTRLSKPTVSSVIQYLEACGLVRQQGIRSGTIGRPSVLYEPVARAGHVFAADVGGTNVRAGLADSYGDVIAEAIEPTAKENGRVVEQIGRIFRTLAEEAGLQPHQVWAAGIGVPGLYDAETDRVSAIPNLPDLREVPVAAALRNVLGIAVAVDNDVNLAAVGERWHGLAADLDHFVTISIGTGIGMGIVVHGEIYRGSRGAAGEIDFLPIGPDTFDGWKKDHSVGAEAFDPTSREAIGRQEALAGHGPLELVSTAPAILQRLEQRLAAGEDATALRVEDGVVGIFRAAEQGEPLARDLIDAEARTVALAIVTVAAVLDPQMVVLGGGVGSNPGLLAPVRRYVAGLFPRPIDIRTSALGDAAAFHGAIAAGLRAARQRLLAQMVERT